MATYSWGLVAAVIWIASYMAPSPPEAQSFLIHVVLYVFRVHAAYDASVILFTVLTVQLEYILMGSHSFKQNLR
jgi:hypothetical protein